MPEEYDLPAIGWIPAWADLQERSAAEADSGFVLGAAETAATAVFWSGYRDIVAFGLLILVLIVRPSGLLGAPEIRKV